MARYLSGINPAVLKWAREAAGLSRADIATAFKKKEDIIESWETGETSPTYHQLEKLAYQYYKRPIAIFFMPEHPKEKDIKKAFRSLPEIEKQDLSADTLYAIRIGMAMQMSLKEISGGVNPASKEIFKDISLSLKKPTLFTTEIVRDYLGVSIEDQLNFSNSEEALSTWRDTIEKVGIFVFKRSLKQRSVSGFCLADDVFPIMMLNNSTAKNRQIFSIFHELSHILLSDSAITKDDYLNDYYAGGDLEETEKYCNKFASDFLVPPREFEDDIDIEVNDSNLESIADKYSVSREVILRKYLDYSKISSAYYRQKMEEWNKQYYEKSGRPAGGSYYRNQAHYLGKNYLALAFSGYYQGRYSLQQLADYLNVKVSSVPGLEQEFRRSLASR